MLMDASHSIEVLDKTGIFICIHGSRLHKTANKAIICITVTADRVDNALYKVRVGVCLRMF